MEKFIINGGKPLNGEITVGGAKNSVLPILAGTLLIDGISVIHNCPNLSDVRATIKILEYLGCNIKRENHTVIVDATNVKNSEVPDDLMREMRSSIIFLGSILGRMGKVTLSSPGGCEIGLRPIDLHLSSAKMLGVNIKSQNGLIICEKGDKGLVGNKITLSFPSVGATENIILMAVLSKGTTVINNAASEPEISDLSDFLNRCGAKIHGAGTGTVVIDGVKKLHGAEHTVIPDRIEAASYLMATAVTKGNVTISNIIPAHLNTVLMPLRETGCNIEVKGKSVTLNAPLNLKRFKIVRTMPYPYFPTDAQAQLTALATVCKGTSVVVENIFESRFKYVGELLRFGAKISIESRMAVIEGVKSLYGAKVKATDLRGGFAMMIAGLCAEGETTITDIYHIDRGYENPEKVLKKLGADVERVTLNGTEKNK